MVQRVFTILYAEDSSDDAVLFESALRRACAHFLLRVVSDGRCAVNYLEGVGEYADRTAYPFPHIVFLDWRMPIVDGGEFLRWCRQSPRFSSLPVIVMGGHSPTQKVQRAVAMGANLVFEKIADRQKLADCLSEICSWFSDGVVSPRISCAYMNARTTSSRWDKRAAPPGAATGITTL